LPGVLKHVRFNVHAYHCPYAPGHRHGELAGPAAQIHHHVLAGQLESARERVDGRAGVSVPVAAVVARCITTEIALHVLTIPSGISAENPVLLTAEASAAKAISYPLDDLCPDDQPATAGVFETGANNH
jgi:hypothetical protein